MRTLATLGGPSASASVSKTHHFSLVQVSAGGEHQQHSMPDNVNARTEHATGHLNCAWTGTSNCQMLQRGMETADGKMEAGALGGSGVEALLLAMPCAASWAMAGSSAVRLSNAACAAAAATLGPTMAARNAICMPTGSSAPLL